MNKSDKEGAKDLYQQLIVATELTPEQLKAVDTYVSILLEEKRKEIERAFELGGNIVDYEGDLRPKWRQSFSDILEILK